MLSVYRISKKQRTTNVQRRTKKKSAHTEKSA
nr:MAG TPA: hypothetical protein [Bacteriophage sp.]